MSDHFLTSVGTATVIVFALGVVTGFIYMIALICFDRNIARTKRKVEDLGYDKVSNDRFDVLYKDSLVLAKRIEKLERK